MTELRLRRDGVAWKDTADGVMALDEWGAVYLAANPSGALLWRALAAGATWDELVTELAAAFAIDHARAASDVDAFLTELSERGLLAADSKNWPFGGWQADPADRSLRQR